MLDWGLRLALRARLAVRRRRCSSFPRRWSRRCSSAASSTRSPPPRRRSRCCGYGVGLLGLIGVKILAPGFYARQDIRTPVTIAVVVLALTQAMNALFVPHLGHAGLALSVEPRRDDQRGRGCSSA